MGVARGMKNAGASVCDMGNDGNHLQTVHETNGVLTGTFQSKGNDTTTAVGKIFLTQRIVFVLGQSGIVYPSHAFIVAKELRHLLGVLAVALHSEVKRLETEVEEEGILGTLDAAEVAHELGCGFGDICHFSETFGIGKSVVTFIGSAETREFVGM